MSCRSVAPCSRPWGSPRFRLCRRLSTHRDTASAPSPRCLRRAPTRLGSSLVGVDTGTVGVFDEAAVLGLCAFGEPDAVGRGGGPRARRVAFLVTHHPSEILPRRQPRRVTAALASPPFYRSSPGSARRCHRAETTRRLSPTSRPCSTVESVATIRVAASCRPILPWACVVLRVPPGCLACVPKAARLPALAGTTVCCLECRQAGSAPRASGLCGRHPASRGRRSALERLSTPAVPSGLGSPGRPTVPNLSTPKRREVRFPSPDTTVSEVDTEMPTNSKSAAGKGKGWGPGVSPPAWVPLPKERRSDEWREGVPRCCPQPAPRPTRSRAAGEGRPPGAAMP
jgi:hypothetical protein